MNANPSFGDPVRFSCAGINLDSDLSGTRELNSQVLLSRRLPVVPLGRRISFDPLFFPRQSVFFSSSFRESHPQCVERSARVLL